jgi:glycosyltransferase involved in cell wall biosynthesis
VLIPVYNERPLIEDLIARVEAVDLDLELVVVDDASTDGTRELLQTMAEEKGERFRLILQPRNQGKGSALRAGLPYVRGQYVVIQDGDAEYDPNDFVSLLKPALEQGAEVVYGSRFLRGSPTMRLPNLLINRLLAWMVRVLYGSPMTDEATCYKLFRTEVLRSIPLTCRRFEFCPEVTAKVLRRGIRIVEVPIRYNARSIAEGKKIRWTDGPDAIWTLLRYRFWRG